MQSIILLCWIGAYPRDKVTVALVRHKAFPIPWNSKIHYVHSLFMSPLVILQRCLISVVFWEVRQEWGIAGLLVWTAQGICKGRWFGFSLYLLPKK